MVQAHAVVADARVSHHDRRVRDVHAGAVRCGAAAGALELYCKLGGGRWFPLLPRGAARLHASSRVAVPLLARCVARAQNLDGRKMSDELVKFVKERVALEEAYAKGLAKLSTSCTLPRHAWRRCWAIAPRGTHPHANTRCCWVWVLRRQTWVL